MPSRRLSAGDHDGGPVPWQQIVDPVDLVVWNAGEGVGEPGLGIDAIEFCGLDQGVGDGGGFAAGLRTDEEGVLAAQSDGPHCAFGGVVVEFQDAVIEVGAQPRHPVQGRADRAGQRAFSRYSGQLGVQPSLQVVEGGFCLGLSDLNPFVRG